MDQKYEGVLREMERWLAASRLDEKLRGELAALRGELASDSENVTILDEIYERFYKEIAFGTGGLRGILGAGTNRMNLHTVGRAAQGMANCIRKTGCKNPSVAIAFDSRNMSAEFARVTASVMAANGIEVYLYRELMPTPALSFAVRYYGCCGGVMITASHNPAKYNGFKAYNDEGCQFDLRQADEVYAEIQKLDCFADVKTLDEECAQAQNARIHEIPKETEDAYLAAVLKERMGVSCRDLSVVYTPLCGAGNKPVRRALAEIGVGHVEIVAEQEKPDGDFPTCPYPNPEKKEALAAGLALCRRSKRADLLLATDPDCDRVGVAVRCGREYRLLSGNEIAVLLLDFICRMRGAGGAEAAGAKPLPQNPLAIRTVVSSQMTDAVAQYYGVEMRSVLTGFKFIGQQIGLLEQRGETQRYIFGFEESYGYLSGTYVRDKDAVNASVLICEMAAQYKTQGKTLFDRLQELYDLVGCYQNEMADFIFEGASGMEQMEGIMERLRREPPDGIGGRAVLSRIDYLRDDTGLPASNVLSFALAGDCGLIVRPSGTEPKLKCYLSARGKNKEEAAAVLAALREEAAHMVQG